MKFLSKQLLAAALILAMSGTAFAAESNSNANTKIRVINFKQCAEQSKSGKQEQASFEALKKQMEEVLLEKEKPINEMAEKFEDPDYLDGLSPEAETELKRKFRALSQEFSQLQQQYLQTLQQTNFKVVQKLSETVSKASKQYAQKEKIDLILNDEVAFFAAPNLDVSKEIIAVMDQTFEQENKQESTSKPQTQNTTPAKEPSKAPSIPPQPTKVPTTSQPMKTQQTNYQK